MSSPNEVLWKPFPGFQERVMACGSMDALIGGAAGPGKTDCIIYFPLRFAHKAWFRGLILRRALDDLQEIEDRLAAVIPRMFPGAKFNSQKRRWNFPAGGWLRYGYCDRYADIEKYMGTQYTYIGWDEVGQVPEERWITKLMHRLRSPDPEGKLHCYFRGSANPGGVGHAWLKGRYVTPTKHGARRITVRDVNPLSNEIITSTRAFIPGLIQDNPIYASDAQYIGRLMGLPEREREALLFGNWDAAGGLAFPELTARTHLIPAIGVIPKHWKLWGGYDWGFAHWGVLVVLAQDEKARILVLDAIWHRRALPDTIANLVAEQWDPASLDIIYAGSDVKNEGGGRSDDTPSVRDKLVKHDWPLGDASTARVAGYQHLLDLISYRGRGPGGADTVPTLYFCNTPGVRRGLEQMKAMVTDPDRPNDVLKVDTDEEGKGGDDFYDALRYGIASHLPPPEQPEVPAKSAWDPAMLAAQAERIRRHTSVVMEPEDRGPLARALDGADNQWEVT